METARSGKIAYRKLDVERFVGLRNADNPKVIGANGKTLWMSTVIQRDIGTPVGRQTEGAYRGWIHQFLVGVGGKDYQRLAIGTLKMVTLAYCCVMLIAVGKSLIVIYPLLI